MITFDAHFDGEHLHPVEPVVLPQNVRLRVTVDETWAGEAASAPATNDAVQKPQGLFEQLFEGVELIDGPSDWSRELDHYLYGTPKRGDNTSA